MIILVTSGNAAQKEEKSFALWPYGSSKFLYQEKWSGNLFYSISGHTKNFNVTQTWYRCKLPCNHHSKIFCSLPPSSVSVSFCRKKLKSNVISWYGLNVVVAAFIASVARTIDTVDRVTSSPWLPETFTLDTVSSFGEILHGLWLIEKLLMIWVFLGTLLLFNWTNILNAFCVG